MTIFTAYLEGLRTTFRNGKMWFLLYALNFLFAIILAYPLSSLLNNKLSKVPLVDKLFDGFDYTIVNDIVKKYGDAVSVFGGISLYATLLYLLLSIFLVGGILNVFIHHNTSTNLNNFWSGAGKYFFRMLRLTVYFLIIQGVTAFIFSKIYGWFTEGGFENFDSEKFLWDLAYIIGPIYLFVATVLFMVHDYAKIHIVHSDKTWITQPILNAFKMVFKNFGRTLLLYLLNLLTFLFFFCIYWKINGPLGGSSILMAFLIGQLFIVFRIGTKLLNLGSAVAWSELGKKK